MMAKIEIPQLKDGVAVQANKYMEAGNRIAPAHPIISRASGPRVCWYFLMYVRLSLEIRKLSKYKKLPKQAFLNQVTEYSKETSCSVIMVNNKNKRKLRKFCLHHGDVHRPNFSGIEIVEGAKDAGNSSNRILRH